MRHHPSRFGLNAVMRAARHVIVAATAAAMLAGCSGSPGVSTADVELAHDALKIALDGWKKGDTPSALRGGSPSITVQDLDWLAGARLVDYRVVGEEKAIETNLYIPVKLTLRTRKGKEIKKSVSYIVGTHPYVTVFRDIR